ncbi:LOW QUALITY PROTEIN: hypothetical protein HID58_091236 [Brassica napus]|uniref:Uncharacterized protein n=1 Tax=Brassica napus TaxID=3708 RepID=A0ABQ7X3H4_BRANA|nr:LOW QUALITY PROTEIN: hypothetical protein HID58_091236 [Brassica napus]
MEVTIGEEETAERRDHERNLSGIFRTSSRDHQGDSQPITRQINWSLSRMKESAVTKFKTFQIPVDWMLENGITSERVSAELEAIGGGGPEEEELMVQGVRFAFHVKAKGLDHLLLFWFGSVTTFFAGGFDAETNLYIFKFLGMWLMSTSLWLQWLFCN